MYIDADEFERENLEFDIKRYIGQVFASWMSPSNPPFSQEYAKPPYIDKLTKGIVDYITNRYKTRKEHHNDEDFPGKDLSAWDLLDKMKSGDKELYNKVEDFMKAMGGESSQANNSMWTSTSTADDLTDKEEEEEEKKVNWRDFRENTTGTGASVGAGAGEAFATPKAFKKKRK